MIKNRQMINKGDEIALASKKEYVVESFGEEGNQYEDLK